jgi:hypothetical protein
MKNMKSEVKSEVKSRNGPWKEIDGCHELGKGTSMEKYNLVCGEQVWDPRG